MASIIICGGGVIGLSAAMMLGQDGHDVTVLEADPQVPPAAPAQAWEGWDRKGSRSSGSRTTCSPGSGTCAIKNCQG